MCNLRNKTIIISCILLCLVVLFIVAFNLVNNHDNNKKAMFNVATETRGSWISSGITHYFTIYDNGTIEETEKFEATKTEIHDLYKIEKSLKAESTKTDDIPIYSSEIIKIINEMGNSLVGKYFIVNDRYFFSTTINEMPAKEFASSLFEYFPDNNDFEKITDFQDTYVTDLEVLS